MSEHHDMIMIDISANEKLKAVPKVSKQALVLHFLTHAWFVNERLHALFLAS